MVSHDNERVQLAPGSVQPYHPERPRPEQSVRTEMHELLAKLRQLPPDDHRDVPLREGALVRPRLRMSDVIDAQEVRRKRTEPWSTGALIATDLLVVATLLVALVYGPPYYKCSQMKRDGMFYYGTTVRSCVRDNVSARYDKAEDFVRRTAYRS